MKGFFLIYLLLIPWEIFSQGLSGAINKSSGQQAGRDVNNNQKYYYGQLDNTILSTGISIAKNCIKSKNKDISLGGDSLFVLCERALKDNEFFKKNKSQISDFIVNIFNSGLINLSDNELDVVTFAKESDSKLMTGGTCQAYSYKEFGFQSGKRFVRKIFPYKDGFARIAIVPSDTMQPIKYGMLDNKGQELIKAIFDTVYDITEGLVLVKSGINYSFYDTNGVEKRFNLFGYNHVYPFSNGYARVVKNNWNGESLSYINHNGIFLQTDYPFNTYSGDINHSLVSVSAGYLKKNTNGRFELVSRTQGTGFNSSGYAVTLNGQVIDTGFRVIGQYNGIKMIDNGFTYGDEIITYGATELIGLLNSKGQNITQYAKYKSIQCTQYDFWIVTDANGLSSIINNRGHELVPFANQKIDILSAELIKVTFFDKEKSASFFTIDIDGNSTDADACN